MRVGIVVSGKVGNAVVRNRVRRRLREALRELMRERGDWAADALHAGTPSFDLVVIARPEAAQADFHQLKGALDRSLAKAALW